MDAAGITAALVWHAAQFDLSVQDGNDLVTDAVAESDRLMGCWAILPPITGELGIGTGSRGGPFKPQEFFAAMRQHRIAALRAFPEQHRFLFNRAALGAFMDQAAERRIPVLFSVERGTLWPTIYSALREFPNLTCILCDIGTWGQDRHVWPLLETYERVYVETSYLALEAGGIAATVRRFGSDRLLFGTGFPLRYPEASTLALLHADVSEEDKHKIAAGNLHRLIQETRL